MYTNTYLSDIHHAKQELARLRSIETNLQNQIIDLLEDSTYNASAWRSVYTDRLTRNVRPAIKECVDYIKSHS